MNRLNFNHLFYFYIVAREGSIKLAAEKINVSQPTISDQIKLLEEDLGCLLFDRVGKSLRITQEGKLALEYAQNIFALSSELKAKINNQDTNIKKTLDIGITHYMSHYFLYETVLPLFEQKEISINIIEADRRHLIADLDSGELDILFTDNRDSLLSNMNVYKVGSNRTFVVAHKQYRSTKKTFPNSLNDIPFFNYTSESFFSYEIALFFSKNQIHPRIIGQADDIDLQQLVTEKGLAFTIVPEVAKKRFCKNKDVISLGEIKDFQSSVWGVVRSNYKGLGFQLLNKMT